VKGWGPSVSTLPVLMKLLRSMTIASRIDLRERARGGQRAACWANRSIDFPIKRCRAWMLQDYNAPSTTPFDPHHPNQTSSIVPGAQRSTSSSSRSRARAPAAMHPIFIPHDRTGRTLIHSQTRASAIFTACDGGRPLC
jgi:hypothetical protein